MKHSVKRLLALVLSCALLSVCAFAADFTGRADELHALGLFKGTGTDEAGNPVYNLDAAPTRAEAVTMLVRLLGKDAEALEGDWDVPFTDLDGADAWALPYVGYAYANKLTTGETDTLFGTNNRCSAQMYCTFVLRSLGYSDAEGADFTYASALEFATEKGLLDEYLAQGDFLRDEIAAVSYSALLTPLKDSETLLINKLVEDGAVEADAAKLLTDKLALYNEFNALSAGSSEGTDSIDMSMKMDMTMSMGGVQVPMNMEGSQKVKVTETGVELASVMTITALEQTQTLEQYLKDGVMYTNDGENKVKAPYTSADDALAALSPSDLSGAASSPLYFIESISKAEADGKVSYTIVLPGNLLTSMTETVIGSMGQAEGLDSMSIGNITMVATFENDALSSITMDMPMSVTAEGQTVDVAAKIEMTINAMGDGVVIEFPADLDTYVEAAE